MSEYPEHEKLALVAPKSQAVGEFLDWLRDTKHVVLAGPGHTHNDDCYYLDTVERGADRNARYLACGLLEGQLLPHGGRIQTLLAEFFEVDEQKIDDEKRAMLDHLHKQRDR